MNKSAIAITGFGLVLPKSSSNHDAQNQTVPELIPRKLRRFSTRSIPTAVAACHQAVESCGLDEKTLCEKVALYTAQSGYQHPDFDDFADALKGWDRHVEPSLLATLWQSRQVNPFLITKALSNNLIGIISQIWRLKNDGVAFIRDQAGSAAALDEAYFQLSSGYAEVAMVVMSGCDEDCYTAVAEQRPLPINTEHTGAAVLILESEAHAKRRGANVQAWINSFSSNSQENTPWLDGAMFREREGLEWGGIVMAITQSLQHVHSEQYQGHWSVEADYGNKRTARAILRRDTE
ncbi:hypothetical protein PTW35_25620 (plasmid) [Photobacterium sp. DA100]|uniref:hypothetical protein n=1 Tax=Photobacterium sp. DA100 TaxID=3027472 RepID=UPI00247A643D|nr:hypothetical protein [Photobacterium sp. DA100]WEM44642.1 hypothetical protein PTW35_25620 [Photobacterium sp. DA100]